MKPDVVLVSRDARHGDVVRPVEIELVLVVDAVKPVLKRLAVDIIVPGEA